MTTAAIPANQSTLPPAQVAKIWQSAQEFESMALGELLKPMFDTVETGDTVFGGGEAENTWKPMMVDAIAKQIGHSGGLGLAAPVFAEMLRRQEAQPQVPTKTVLNRQELSR